MDGLLNRNRISSHTLMSAAIANDAQNLRTSGTSRRIYSDKIAFAKSGLRLQQIIRRPG